MSQQLYHCKNCDAVFSAPVPLEKGFMCPECGRSPFDAFLFKQGEVVESDVAESTHGVPGLDAADFISMQKMRRRRQARFAIIVWLLVLVGAIGISIYYQNEQDRDNTYRQEVELELQKTLEAKGDCMEVLVKYSRPGATTNEKSEFVVKGVSKILKMQQYTKGAFQFRPKKPFSIEDVAYFEGGDFPRLEMLLKDDEGRFFEAVFWKEDGAWKLDWEHYVRYTEDSWNAFLVNKEGDGWFRLYARKRNIGNDGKELKLLFYQPNPKLGARWLESPEVIVERGNPLFEVLSEAFDREKISKVEREKRVLRRKDAPGFLRLYAKLSFVKDSEGKSRLQLEDIGKTYWTEYDTSFIGDGEQ